MSIASRTPLIHARYLAWAMRAIAAANRQWHASHPGEPPLMTRSGLHWWLYEAGIEAGWIPGPRNGSLLNRSPSWWVAQAFQREPWTVQEAARDYWRYLKSQT